MNKISTLILFILLSAIAPMAAQPYQSVFANSGATEWVYRWGSEFGVHNDTVFIQKDTIVNGIQYKKLVQSYYHKIPLCLLREDIHSGTVWCRSISYQGHQDDTLERIASRMDLNIGDTFNISNIRLYPGSYPDSLNLVDSISFKGGFKYIYLKGIYKTYNEPYTLIEGVGPNMGIFWKYAVSPAHPFTGGYYLLCSYKNGQKTSYENRYYKGACWIGTGIDEVETGQITIYPQPASNVLNINNNSNQSITKVQLINYIGTVVQEYASPVISRLDLSNIPRGYYMLKMYSVNGYLTTRPLIIR